MRNDGRQEQFKEDLMKHEGIAELFLSVDLLERCLSKEDLENPVINSGILKIRKKLGSLIQFKEEDYK
jgi:hypothetical protein